MEADPSEVGPMEVVQLVVDPLEVVLMVVDP